MAVNIMSSFEIHESSGGSNRKAEEKNYNGVLLAKHTLLQEEETGRLMYYLGTDRSDKDLSTYYHKLSTSNCGNAKIRRYTTDRLIKEFVVYGNDKRIEKVEAVAKELDRFEPDIPEQYYTIDSKSRTIFSGWDCDATDVRRFKLFNVFETRTQAEKASDLLRVPRAVAMACVLVDPDYKPDWGDTTAQKFRVFYTYGTERWTISVSCNYIQPHPYVSTREKAEQVCALLTKWGVKP